MKILCWNCRGMRKPAAVRALLGIQGRVRPDVLFLSEAHLNKAKAEKLRRRLGFEAMAVSESDGRSGGLVMFWYNKLGVTSHEVQPNFIDIRINEGNNGGWRFTGFYGEPSGERKHLTWEYVRQLHAMMDMPWLMAGDFNEILHSHEKEGGVVRPQRCMQAFSDALADCGLDDLGYVGDKFSWRRGHIRERLDRATSNVLWADMFPGFGVTNEEFDKSDHRPVLIDTEYQLGVLPRGPSGPRKFEARWLAETDVETIVQTSWDNRKALDAAPLSEITADIHAALHRWDKEVLKGPRTRLRELQKKLNEVLSGPLTDDAVVRQHELHMQIENLLEQEEIYWLQRGRADWLTRGDRNTDFFHRAANGRHTFFYY